MLSPNFNYEECNPINYKNLTSEEYYKLLYNKKGNSVKLIVWCGKNNHKPWKSIVSNLLSGKWCHKCADEEKIKFSLNILKELANKRGQEETGVGGRILNSKNSNEELTIDTYNKLTSNKSPGKTHFWWDCCLQGHTAWKTTPSHIANDKTWCPICKMGLYTYLELIKLAKIRGYEETGIEGKILDSKNKNIELTEETYDQLTSNKKASAISFWWSCGNNHNRFRNSPANIRRGQWCPICSSNEGKFEKIIRGYFEEIFDNPFPETNLRNLNLRFKKVKIELELLKENNKLKIVGYDVIDKNYSEIYKGKMRFDGYTEIIIEGKLIKIAFEYNGIQHYEFPNYWFKDTSEGYKAWISYIERDQIKKEICKSNNIILIEFPHYLDRALEHPNKIRSYIINKFESATGQTLE